MNKDYMVNLFEFYGQLDKRLLYLFIFSIDNKIKEMKLFLF